MEKYENGHAEVTTEIFAIGVTWRLIMRIFTQFAGHYAVSGLGCVKTIVRLYERWHNELTFNKPLVRAKSVPRIEFKP